MQIFGMHLEEQNCRIIPGPDVHSLYLYNLAGNAMSSEVRTRSLVPTLCLVFVSSSCL